MPSEPRKLLTAHFDVTGWTPAQIEALMFEISAQGVASTEHPEMRPDIRIDSFSAIVDADADALTIPDRRREAAMSGLSEIVCKLWNS